MSKILSVLIMLLSLVGCANIYTAPNPGSTSQPLVSIRGSYQSTGIAHWQVAVIDSVDNKNVSYLFHDWSGSQLSKRSISVTSNMPHNFIIKVAFNQKLLSGGPSVGLVEINTSLKPGKNYQVKGSFEGNHVMAWIVDDTGAVVSPVATGVYQHEHTKIVYVH